MIRGNTVTCKPYRKLPGKEPFDDTGSKGCDKFEYAWLHPVLKKAV